MSIELFCVNKITINIIFDFEIEYGSLNLIETAYSYVPDTSKVVNLGVDKAPYKCDTTFKGITDDVLNQVTTSINYLINDSTEENLPVRVFNSYNPMGNTTPMWMTNINPQSDYYAHIYSNGKWYLTKDIAAESDMLYLTYEDDLKLGYYGSNIEKKHNIWFFDTIHDKEVCPVIKKEKLDEEGNHVYFTEKISEESDDYSPNSVFKNLNNATEMQSTQLTNFDIACSLGNYSIKETYNITLTNISDDKIIEFRNNNWQNCIVEVYDSKSNQRNIFYTGRGDMNAQDFATNDRLLHSVRINKGETICMTVTVTLVTGDPGGIINYIKCYNAK